MTIRRLRIRAGWVPLAAFVTLAHAQPSAAQAVERLSLGVSAARAEARVAGFGSGVDALSGVLLGVEGRASLWWLHARGEYRFGRLESDGPGRPMRDAVFARASLGVRPVSWLAVTAGPRIATVDSDSGDRRVVRWRVEVHGSAPLVPGIASGFVSVGGSVAGTDVDWANPSGGGDVGLLFAVPDRPLWASLGYRMDREYLTDGSWQTVETTYLAIGVSVPNWSAPGP